MIVSAALFYCFTAPVVKGAELNSLGASLKHPVLSWKVVILQHRYNNLKPLELQSLKSTKIVDFCITGPIKPAQ